MICATCLSCEAIEVFGNADAKAGWPLSALVSTALYWLAWVATVLAAWISDTPLSKLRSCWAAPERALQIAEPSEQLRPEVLPGVMTEGLVSWPVHKICAPATD